MGMKSSFAAILLLLFPVDFGRRERLFACVRAKLAAGLPGGLCEKDRQASDLS